jgi:hypothetical protein
VDSRAALAAVMGVLFGLVIGVAISAADAKRAGRQQWRGVSALCALGIGIELGIVTEGNHSRPEHNVVLAVELILLAWFVIAAGAGRRAQRRDHP